MIFIKKIIRLPFSLFWSKKSQLNNQQKANEFPIINKPKKKRFFSFIKRNKKVILVSSIFLLVFFSLYQISLALIVPGVAELVVWTKEVGKTMFFLAALPLLALIFFEIGEVLLSWATLPNPLVWDFTMANPIINIGWTVVRDFVNMFFILILIVIGLGVALRLKEYDIKKLLPKFFAAVLLVNFGPPIFALIAEIAETFMNFFLVEVRGLGGFNVLLRGQFWITFTTYLGILGTLSILLLVPGGWTAAAGLISIGIGIGFGTFADILMITLFSLISGMVFIMFAFLLLARQIAIWILIILSPVAFLLWALPGNKIGRYATMWWNQFLQWSFIGVPAAFFLYLAAKLTVEPMPGITSIFQLIVVVIFLIIGFIITIKMAPVGAGFVTNLAISSTKRVAGFTGRKAFEKVAPGLRESTIRYAKRVEEKAAGGSRIAKFEQRLGLQRASLKLAAGAGEVTKRKEEQEMKGMEALHGKNLVDAKEGEVFVDSKNEAVIWNMYNEIKDPAKKSAFLSRIKPDDLRTLSRTTTQKQRKDLIKITGTNNINLAVSMANETGDFVGKNDDDTKKNIYRNMSREQFGNIKDIDFKAFEGVIKDDLGRTVKAIQDGINKNPELLEKLTKVTPDVKIKQILKNMNLEGYVKQDSPKRSIIVPGDTKFRKD